MNTSNVPHKPLLCIPFLTSVFAFLVAVLLCIPAFAATLDSKEGEQMVLSNGAVVTAGGDSVRMDANGRQATWTDGGSAGGDTVAASFSADPRGTTRVCLNLLVNGANRGERCISAGQTAWAERSWTGLSLSDSDDLAFSASRVDNNEVLYLDKARVDGTAPVTDSDGDGVPDPDDACPANPGPASTGGCPTTNMPPALGAQTGPVTVSQDGFTGTLNVRCNSTDPRMDQTNQTVGVRIAADDVRITNMSVSNCGKGLAVAKQADGTWPKNLTISAGKFDHNRMSIYIPHLTGGDIGDAPDGVDGSRNQNQNFRITDTYRIVEIAQSTDLAIHDLYADCGSAVWGSQASEGGCHAGMKFLADRRQGPPYLVANNSVKDTIIKNVSDEYIGMDGRFNTTGQQALVGTDPVTSVNQQANTFVLRSANWGAFPENLVGMYATVVDGPSQGRAMRITAHSGSSFGVADPNGYLSGVGAGTRIAVGLAYEGNRFDSNTIDSRAHHGGRGSKTGMDAHAVGNYGTFRNNTILGNFHWQAIPAYHQRILPDGTVAGQCIDIRTGIMNSQEVGSTNYAVASHNSVTGNLCQPSGSTSDISLTNVTWSQPYAGFVTENYAANNTLTNGQAVTYGQRILAADPNP